MVQYRRVFSKLKPPSPRLSRSLSPDWSMPDAQLSRRSFWSAFSGGRGERILISELIPQPLLVSIVSQEFFSRNLISEF